MERLEERYLRWVLGMNGVTFGVFDKGGDTKRKDKKQNKKKGIGV